MSENQQKTVPTAAPQKKVTSVGKRFMCTKCGFEFIVTRGGSGSIRCCGESVVPKK